MQKVTIDKLADPAYTSTLSQNHKDWIYNGLDCAVTFDLSDILAKQLREAGRYQTYEFEMGMCGPALTMMRRGLKIDPEKRQEMEDHSHYRHERLRELIIKVVVDSFDEFTAFNPNSAVQLKKLFYQVLAIPKIKKSDKGKWKVAADREALEKIIALYPRGKFFAEIILELRATAKDLEVLTVRLDDDFRHRCSYNVAGTETGRWSSSESNFYTGGNQQNIRKHLREIVVPDPGYKMFYADLDQAEARIVAYTSEDENYIAACEGPDLHTDVVKMVWPKLPWTDDPKQNRAIADRIYYRDFSYRDLCKRGGHGTNYGLEVPSLARHLHIEQMYAHRFQLLYYGGQVSATALERWHKMDPMAGFDDVLEMGTAIGKDLLEVPGAFPGIRKWHRSVLGILETEGSITTVIGRERVFWSRLTEASTLREAIAYEPQSTVGELLNMGLYRIWNELEPEVQTLAQIHDAVLGQFPEDEVDKYSEAVLNCMTNPLTIKGRLMKIPSSIEVGDNWKEVS
jgi:DNA polymerase I-like protein with 3'-5' exonuclease and polymerase domains